MGFNFNISFGNNKPLHVERNERGNWFYEMWNSMFSAGKIKTNKARLDAVLDNPAVMLAFKQVADFGSLGRIHKFNDSKVVEQDALYKLKKRPNYFQTWEQFLKDYYFYVNIGTAYLYDNSIGGKLSDNDQLYFLNPAGLKFTIEQKEVLGGLVLSQKEYNNVMKTNVKYCQPNGKEINIPLKNIKPFFSVSNGLSGNWFEGLSVLDTLYKIINLSDESLNALGVNLKYSQKFGVSAKSDKQNLNEFGAMGTQEKGDIEQKIASKKEVTVSKSPLQIERFVSDIQKLKLDETFLTQYFIISKMLGIPKDMAEAYVNGGATFENQDKSAVKFISSALQPLGDPLVGYMFEAWGFEDLRITWEHLPIYASAKKSEEESRKIALENLQLAKELGFNEKDVNNSLTEIMQ